MANYSYQSSSYSSSAGGGAGAADASFQQADTNHDGSLDINEFRNFVGQNIGASGAGYGASSSSFESSAFESSSAALGGGAALAYDASAYGAGGAVGAGSSAYESASASFSSGGYGGEAALVAGGQAYEAASSSTQVQQYATDSQGLFQDSNPQIIRRPAPGGVQTYTQNIRVRFLQPPPVPPPGPLIIREVRPPQPPPPPPLRIRQQAPPLPQPPPLVLRERPPVAPVAIASQTVIRRLAAIPVPPRSVIIERLPPLPPRPRDIIIERWIPYGAQAKRRTIVQRAGAAVQYPRPRNVIIQYDTAQVRVVRQFQRLGVVQASPAAYLQQYGAQLLDAGSLLQQARAAGVVEDISPPGFVGSAAIGYSASTYGAGGLEAAAAGGGEFSSSSFESASYSSGGGAGAVEAAYVGGAGGYGASSSSFESAGYAVGGGAGLGVADAAFAAADTNQDGGIDRAEFANFVGGGGGGHSSFQSSSYSAESTY